ncbi:hypothetical protein ABZ805_03060 [Saccharopolyspora sp. NPDC047091]|uniref:hypothetical protein n=1 Tax=Saccharopolyspora sp. NPDC047091 TaxID=3155924 RepID=UPI0033D7A230
MSHRQDITHPRAMPAHHKTCAELARSIDTGDPGAEHLRGWARVGTTATLRTNAIAVLSKRAHRDDVPVIIEVLEEDEKVRVLSLASEVSKLMQHDWRTCLRVAKDPSTAPEPTPQACQGAG